MLTALLFVILLVCNDTAPTEIYTLSLHDALPICTGGPLDGMRARPGPPGSARRRPRSAGRPRSRTPSPSLPPGSPAPRRGSRSEEHTSELQSRQYLVCRLLLEKKNKNKSSQPHTT